MPVHNFDNFAMCVISIVAAQNIVESTDQGKALRIGNLWLNWDSVASLTAIASLVLSQSRRNRSTDWLFLALRIDSEVSGVSQEQEIYS